MIFIGPNLSDPNAHFITNVVDSIGSKNDLVLDLHELDDKWELFDRIRKHLVAVSEEFIIYNAKENEDFFFFVKQYFPELKFVIFFSDDEWRHANYDRYLALYADAFTIAVKANIEVYQQYGLEPFYMRWACNPNMFYPVPQKCKNIDVSFIGSPYGPRVDYIRFLVTNGINVRVYGYGWDRFSDIRSNWGGFLSHEELLGVISQSKINLNFLWTSAQEDRSTIKGRTLELSACRAFQLSNYTDEFINYGFVDGENIAVFNDKDDLLEKIRHYLKYDSEREVIACEAYKHVLRDHTWKQRFLAVFDRLRKRAIVPTKPFRKFLILVLVHQDVKHQIRFDDERLDIRIVDPESDWTDGVNAMDGVVLLNHDSSLNNESLYMMAFGLYVDKSNMIAANFYVGSGNCNYWIRFRDLLMEKKRGLLRKLPISCMMFSGAYAAEHGCKLVPDDIHHKVSYIEYPSFWIKLPYYQSRKLRFYFGFHRDPRKLFKEYIRQLKLGQALSLGIDKFWQRRLRNSGKKNETYS